MIVVALACPAGVNAWDLVNPEQPRAGVVTTTRIVDIIVGSADNQDPEWTDGSNRFVSFVDADVAAACRMMSGEPADHENRFVREAGTLNGRYVVVGELYLPVLLFARAHNTPVRVKLVWNENRPDGCGVRWIQTCFDPNSCRAPAPN